MADSFTLNMPQISLMDFVDFVRFNLRIKKKGIENGSPRVRVMNLWAVSEPGIGKTQMIQKIAEEMGAVCKYIPGANVFQGDLSGIVSVYTPEGKVKPEAIKLMINHYFPRIPENEKELKDPNMEYNKPGFLFVDEILNMDPLVRGELLAYVDGNSKSINGTEIDNFPPSWFIVAASNTEETVGDTFVDLAPNIKAKFETYYVKPDMDSYGNYMRNYKEIAFKTQGFHPVIISYLTEYPDHLAVHFDPKKEQNVASPRNWEAVNSTLREIDDELESGFADIKKTQWMLEQKCIAQLGNEVGQKFLDYYQYEKETIDPKAYITEDLSTSAKFNTFNKKGVQVRLMSMYRALDYLGNTKTEDMKKEDFKKKLKMIQDNTVWLIRDRGEEFIVGFLDAMINRIPVFGVKDLTPDFLECSKKSHLFNI